MPSPKEFADAHNWPRGPGQAKLTDAGGRNCSGPHEGPLPDHEIRRLQIVTPCRKKCSKIKELRVPSFGLGSYGYDAVLDRRAFYVFSNANGGTTDPRKFDAKNLLIKMPPKQDEHGLYYFIVPSNGTALGLTKEAFQVPNDVIGTVFGKSTYSRCALVVNCTLLEPNWRGRLVIELHNSSPVPIKVYADAGICQIVFLRGQACRQAYVGKYQNQKGLVMAKA